MKLREELDKLVNKANEDLEPEMIQCVLKIEDIGNEYKYLGMVEDNSHYASEYDMELEYEEADYGRATIQLILAYHKNGEKVFYDEEGDPLNLDMEEQKEFEQEYQDLNNSKDNTVIPDKDMI